MAFLTHYFTHKVTFDRLNSSIIHIFNLYDTERWDGYLCSVEGTYSAK